MNQSSETNTQKYSEQRFDGRLDVIPTHSLSSGTGGRDSTDVHVILSNTMQGQKQ